MASFIQEIDHTVELVRARKTNIDALVRSGIVMTNIATALLERFARDGTSPQMLAALRMEEALHSGLLAASRFLASRNPADADAAQVELDRMASTLPGLMAVVGDQPRPQRSLKLLGQELPAYSSAIRDMLHNLAALEDNRILREAIGARTVANIAAVRDEFA